MAIFEKVLTEITEELFDGNDDPNDVKLPPGGNGTYIVTMRLKKDLPNWVPMYGRKICFDYRGIKRQLKCINL